MPHAAQTLPEVTADAIGMLGERGYDATSVDDLAGALGISRSTFFRRFGSKEDIVFADHTYLLDRLDTQLEVAGSDPLSAVAAGAVAVLTYHVGRREASLLRNSLLHSNPVLRDRELVTSHRYERAFVSYLRAALPLPPEREWAATALAASVVAVHNRVLRAWLRDESLAAADALRTQLRELTEVFRPMLAPTGVGADGRTNAAPSSARALIAVFDRDMHPEDLFQHLRETLE
ncbi:hypothetical protein GCM10022198_25420 [Klugiella xanthotipulae]|uniref:TetR family transcriptional regulator n=1 Tax=Klugiella xanthotipulae TaxID=244735 RepID=A0A543HYZ5_9MICO|nr:TetR/AcrR family transcriptional regulator [Klugiella xanthotipulae]TQM63567.1 TetR family transcriptional regulator [Klugiella xanthotipulae]